MAKTSSVEKNNRRRKLVDSYAAKRKALYGEIQQKLYEEGGILAPYHKTLLRVISARIKGIEVPFTPDNIPWQNVEIADE